MTLSANVQGALLMTGAMTAFTINDAFMKMLGEDIPLFQLVFLRGVGTLACLILIALRTGAFRAPVPNKDRWMIGLRTVSEIAAAYFFITALFNMPLANISAILQALPLTVALGAALFLGEHVGWRRFLAIGIGFVGVLLIVRPGSGGFNLYSIYALASVICVTFRDLAVRRISAGVPSMTIACVTAAGVMAFGGVGSVFIDWQPMTAQHALLLLGAIVMVIGGYLFSVMSMRVGEIGVVAPFRYTSLLAALLLGLLVFGDWPDGLTQIGAAIVVSTGLFTLWRERQISRRQARARAAR
jgi:S-adenosylmethionine uptake transporter